MSVLLDLDELGDRLAHQQRQRSFGTDRQLPARSQDRVCKHSVYEVSESFTDKRIKWTRAGWRRGD